MNYRNMTNDELVNAAERLKHGPGPAGLSDYEQAADLMVELATRLEAAGLVRIERDPDQWADLDDVLGDTFNPDANPDVKPHVMAREKQHELDRIERDGVWGYIAEHWNGREWVEDESIWGMVGDDFDGSDYDLDLMRAAIDGAESVRHCPTCGQPVTETH